MKRVVLITILLFGFALIYGQRNETLFTINDKKVSSDEFLYIYKKNNNEAIGVKSFDDYLELYINFKLIVAEAEKLKVGETDEFRNELQGYRDQLAKLYLSENKQYDILANEVYNRSKIDAKLDIIFVKVDKNDSPEDLESALTKVVNIKQRILNGENFEKVVSETSDDPRAARTNGHLPYMPVSYIPFELQKHVTSASKKSWSDPIKTSHGYYIVKVINTRPNPGNVKVAHIMIASPKALPESVALMKKNRIDSIYKLLQNGEDFKELAKLSDDKASAKNGGELSWFSSGRMVSEFEEAAFALNKNNDISKPVRTISGWHILKLLDKKDIEPFDLQKKKIKKNLSRNSEIRLLVREKVKDKLKRDYRFKEFQKPVSFYSVVDSTIFQSKWLSEKLTDLNQALFSVNFHEYKENDFALYLESKQTVRRPIPIEIFINEMFEEFIYDCLLEAEKKGLEKKYPQFKFLMQEYRDGMLKFELIKEEIWDKASEDEAGLKKFYGSNKDLYNKQIIMDLSVFNYENERICKHATKLLENSRSDYSDDEIVNAVNEKSKGVFKTEGRKNYEYGDSHISDKIFNLIKNKKINKNQKIVNLTDEKYLVYINSITKSKGKNLEDIKGIVISDYQNYLENKWIEKLKRKHILDINNEEIEKLKQKI